jgi:hypothetical protein
MYEKPQYLTPGGYRRQAKSPAKAARPARAKEEPAAGRAMTPKRISPQAAKLIADTIKLMLRD